MNKSDVVLSESTLVILESANKILKRTPGGGLDKKFLYITISFDNQSPKDTLNVRLSGRVMMAGGDVFDLTIVLMITKSVDGRWKLGTQVTVIMDRLSLRFTVNEEGELD